MSQVLMVLILLLSSSMAKAQMRITEFLYSGANGEFVEFTNVGSTPIDMTGWSFDDATRHVGVHSLTGFGTVQPGESVIVTETSPVSAFRAPRVGHVASLANRAIEHGAVGVDEFARRTERQSVGKRRNVVGEASGRGKQ